MQEISFSTLWGWQGDRATRNHRPFATDAEAKAFRDQAYRDAKRQGLKARRWSNPNQIRQYWGFGDDCGEVCNVYYVTISK
jgi:hypothetical protein